MKFIRLITIFLIISSTLCLHLTKSKVSISKEQVGVSEEAQRIKSNDVNNVKFQMEKVCRYDEDLLKCLDEKTFKLLESFKSKVDSEFIISASTNYAKR